MVRVACGAGLAEVLRRPGPAYLATHPLSSAKAKVRRALQEHGVELLQLAQRAPLVWLRADQRVISHHACSDGAA